MPSLRFLMCAALLLSACKSTESRNTLSCDAKMASAISAHFNAMCEQARFASPVPGKLPTSLAPVAGPPGHDLASEDAVPITLEARGLRVDTDKAPTPSEDIAKRVDKMVGHLKDKARQLNRGFGLSVRLQIDAGAQAADVARLLGALAPHEPEVVLMFAPAAAPPAAPALPGADAVAKKRAEILGPAAKPGLTELDRMVMLSKSKVRNDARDDINAVCPNYSKPFAELARVAPEKRCAYQADNSPRAYVECGCKADYATTFAMLSLAVHVGEVRRPVVLRKAKLAPETKTPLRYRAGQTWGLVAPQNLTEAQLENFWLAPTP